MSGLVLVHPVNWTATCRRYHVRRHKLYSLRCTKKLLKRIGAPPSGNVLAPTTVLGDWYANILFAKPQQLVLCISERTLLPVVLPAKQPAGLPERLRVELPRMLQLLGVSSQAIAEELEQMRQHQIEPTQSKSALGSLNDFMYHLSWGLKDHPGLSLLEHSLRLAEIPCKPLEYSFPVEATASLFRARSVIKAAAGVS